MFAASDWLIRHDGAPSPEMAAYVLAEGLDHHLALVYGEFADELEALAAELGVGVVRL